MSVVILPDPKPDEDAVQLFMQHLGASREIAVRLSLEGHSSIEEVAYVPIEELRETGLDEPVVQELRANARRLLGSKA